LTKMDSSSKELLLVRLILNLTIFVLKTNFVRKEKISIWMMVLPSI
jgi:hypothetical protein